MGRVKNFFKRLPKPSRSFIVMVDIISIIGLIIAIIQIPGCIDDHVLYKLLTPKKEWSAVVITAGNEKHVIDGDDLLLARSNLFPTNIVDSEDASKINDLLGKKLGKWEYQANGKHLITFQIHSLIQDETHPNYERALEISFQVGEERFILKCWGLYIAIRAEGDLAPYFDERGIELTDGTELHSGGANS